MSARQPLQSLGVPDTARVRHNLVPMSCYSSQGATGRASVPCFTDGCGERRCVEDARSKSLALMVWMVTWLIRKVGCIMVESLFTGGVTGR
jgi:hypothetical protein